SGQGIVAARNRGARSGVETRTVRSENRNDGSVHMRWHRMGTRATRRALAAAAAILALHSPALAQVKGTDSEIGLEQAIRQALLGNRELESARLQLVAAEGQVREAWAAVYPTVNATGNYTRNLRVPGQFL